MKFNCDKNTIVKEISVAQEIISSKNAISILSNVLLEAENNTLTIKSTDLKVGYKTFIPVNIIVSGSTSVYCDKFLSILRSLPEGELEIELKEEKLIIKPLFKKINFQLKTLSSEQYPEMNETSEENYFSMPQTDLLEMISQTVFSVSDDETRYFMNGVFMENIDNTLKMVATDGRRLSYIKKNTFGMIKSFDGIIIPPKILQFVLKEANGEGNIFIAVENKTIFFKFDNQIISSNLIEGQFPNYSRVIPEKQDFEVKINRLDFMEAIKRVSLMVENKSRKIFLHLSNNCIELNSEETEIGAASEVIECDYQGENVLMALNNAFLYDPLKVIDDEFIKIYFTEANKAITISSSKKSDYFHILMPMLID